MDDELTPTEGKTEHFFRQHLAATQRTIASAWQDGETGPADLEALRTLWGKSESLFSDGLARSWAVIDQSDSEKVPLLLGPTHGPFVFASAGSGKTANFLALLRKSTDAARDTLHEAGNKLKSATSRAERRVAVRGFLSALADLLLCLLQFLVRAVLMLLSQLIGRSSVIPTALWKPEPIDTSPRVTPRGPNPAFPVITYRGGHYRSTLGSVVLAA
ncbi:hypothetical protein ACFXKX_26280 [Streptomyces scopuliridis]|uniref:hypothetical protein n=1 Tax=Streptomyces scopuliridis TaxID=452529 RepID=UPI00369B0176